MFFKNLMIGSVFTLLTSFYAFAGGQEPYQISEFQDTPNYDCQYILSKYCVTAGWYYDDIGMNQVVEKIDLFGDYSTPGAGVTSFTIGVYDSGISKPNFLFTHNAIDFSLLEHLNKSDSYGLGNRTRHGNMTAGILSLSKMGVDIPTRPMIRAKTLFYSFQNKSEPLVDFIDGYTALLNNVDKPKVISVSVSHHTILSSPLLKASEINLVELYNNNAPLRQLITNNPDVLFVMSGGNEYRNSKYNNGILHYELVNGVLKYKPLANLIVVGAHNPTHKFVKYSNFGKSTDIAAPTGFIGINCATNVIVGNYLRGNVETWTPSDSDTRVVFGGIGDDNYYLSSLPWGLTSSAPNGDKTTEYQKKRNVGCGNKLATANGTSSATPLVSGAAAILFHAADINGFDINNDPNDSRSKITPADIKNYLIDNNGGLITDRFISNFITEINPDDTKTKIPNTRSDAFSDDDGDLYIEMARSIPRLNVNNALDALLADIPVTNIPNYNLINFSEDGYTLKVGGDNAFVVKKIDDNSIADFDGLKGIFIPPNTTVCMFVDEVSFASFEYSDNNDQMMEIAPLSGECEVDSISESSWTVLDSSQVTVPVISFGSNGLSIRLTGAGSGMLIPTIDVDNTTIVFDNQ